MSTMPTPSTFATAQLVNAATLNTSIRDSFLACVSKLDSTRFTSTQANVTFSGISTRYTHLLLVGGFESDTHLGAVLGQLQFNGDTGANYFTHFMGSTGAASSGLDLVNSTAGYGIGVSGQASTLQESAGWMIISNYHSTFAKGWTGTYFAQGSSAAGTLALVTIGGIWNSTAAITSVIAAPFAAGGFAHGSLSLYGI